jgi:hypothetical protein
MDIRPLFTPLDPKFRVTDLYFSVIAALFGIYFTKPSVIIANTSACFLLSPYEPLKNFSLLSDFDLILKTDISKFL